MYIPHGEMLRPDTAHGNHWRNRRNICHNKISIKIMPAQKSAAVFEYGTAVKDCGPFFLFMENLCFHMMKNTTEF